MRSLRFRLPALFLAGFLLAGIVSALIAVRLFQDHAREQTLKELRTQAAGLADLYAAAALENLDEGQRSPRFAAPRLERATGTRLYYAGLDIFPGQISGLRQLDRKVLNWAELGEGEVQTLEFQPPGSETTYLAVAHPLRLGDETFGALVVAKPQTVLQERWVRLVERFALAFLAGLAVAAGLVWYLSRRLTEPVLALSRAADQVSRGRYDADLPEPRSRDEVGHLTERFRDMTRRLAEADARERSFLMRVSHELRTPLTAIRGHVEAMREGLAEDPAARSASLGVIRAEVDRLVRLVGDLLDLARLDAHRFTLTEEEVELRRLLEHAYESRSEEARQRRIEYERVFDADPVIHTDGDRVLQIVSNLLDNAFTWTPDGGRIALGLSTANGMVSVSVADTGPGIGPDEQERIFRPFYSRNGAGGVGLGLAIARELAHALGGDLSLESERGRGARFQLMLPAR
ncbi:MAG TPA: HAMP domain-containing sensor histidine kinase [Gaiellaceae bacterium]|nr:HAMP domain-containing sensor histidine kinase [Gaiellaceae bacterium]